ncbi:hypothetical protein HanRHA438_Chr04g0151071 [Helianthus annuus]|nr:hypothetical protein HanRHA438_Chr04g0151071 [Helianthus annuus]
MSIWYQIPIPIPSRTDPENFGTGNGIHFLAFSVSVFSGSVPVRYGTGKIPTFIFKYRYHTDTLPHRHISVSVSSFGEIRDRDGIRTGSGFAHP